jgi:hypothetical protein
LNSIAASAASIFLTPDAIFSYVSFATSLNSTENEEPISPIFARSAQEKKRMRQVVEACLSEMLPELKPVPQRVPIPAPSQITEEIRQSGNGTIKQTNLAHYSQRRYPR